jgi:hypothetical protein
MEHIIEIGLSGIGLDKYWTQFSGLPQKWMSCKGIIINYFCVIYYFKNGK